MKWEKLVDSQDEFIRRGALLGFPAGQSFEESVIMMVCEGFGNPGEKGLITITGQKAGINLYVIFPDNEVIGGKLQTKWLIDNWNKWVWGDGDVNNVMICRGLNAKDVIR